MRHEPSATLLYCSVTQQELDLIAASGWLAFPLHLAEQSTFRLVLKEEYAAQIAHDWNAPSGVAYVLRFAVEADYATQFLVQAERGRGLGVVQVLAEELAEFNRHILGQIELVSLIHPE